MEIIELIYCRVQRILYALFVYSTRVYVYSGLTLTVRSRDGKTPKFLGPARNKNFYFRPVWARENFLSLMT